MRVTLLSEGIIEEIEQISDASFSSDERAPHGILREQMKQGEVFVISRDSRVVAFAVVTAKAGEPFLWSIAVDPGFRKQGLGMELLYEIQLWVSEKGQTSIGLTVQVDNPAQKLYFDAGYRVTNVLRRYYKTGDGLFMKWRVR